jgi:hypothetical protein
MAGIERHDAGAPALQLDVEGLLFRAALLAGYGKEAQALARRVSRAVDAGAARSCLDAGSPIQLTVDAPGPRGLRIGVRLGDRPSDETLADFLARPALAHVQNVLTKLPVAAHPSLGTWLFWTDTRQSMFVDLRDPDRHDALARLACVLDASQRARLDRFHATLAQARPWVLRLEADEAGLTRVHVHWLLDRHASPERMADAIAPGRWPLVVNALGHLLKRPSATGRWVVVTPLDDVSEPALRLGNSGWSIVPEDGQKHRAVGQMMSAFNGPRDFAEALWSLCQGAAMPGWRVGRACELKISADDAVRVRLFLTPDVQGRTTAGIRSSADVMSWDGPIDAEPSNA